MAHTPGPRAVITTHEYLEGSGTPGGQTDGWRWGKCTCHWSGPKSDNPYGDWQRHKARVAAEEANARLIAAAPALLEALKAIRQVVANGPEHQEAWQMVTGVRNILIGLAAQAEKVGQQ